VQQWKNYKLINDLTQHALRTVYIIR